LSNQIFDAIVIGSGITGGWAAKELTEKGLKTILIERGGPVEHIRDYTTSGLDPWHFEHGGSLTLEEKKKHHVQARHFSIGEDNKHFYINDLENPYAETNRYDWIRADVLGGRSLLWGRMSFRWSDFDFEANAKDGFGPDWPIRYRDLAPWYEYVERFVGISGQAEGIATLPDSVFQAPMEMNCVEKMLKNKIESNYPGRKLIIGRVANLTEKMPGRQACQYRNLCHRGCPFGAYFSTQSSTLPAALKTGNLTVRTNALANRILFDEAKQKASGVEIIDTITGKSETYRARVVFLNASTLASTFLLLNSQSSRFPTGMGNDHDQLGRYLMDHHKSGTVTGRVEGFEDRYYYGRKPVGIFIPRFMNYKGREKDYVRGYNIQGGAGRKADKNGSETLGNTLKSSITEPGPWMVNLNAYGECLPYAENRVSLNNDLKDKWGRPTLTIDCRFRENEEKMRVDAIENMKEMLDSAGLKDIALIGKPSFPGNANHEMGTARMGNDPRSSVLNKWNQLHAVKNLFLTDGACMTSSSSVNPSLTFMALTARAADFAVREMKRGNL
jgi:choline dehydrogenase-like flavoprotein